MNFEEIYLKVKQSMTSLDGTINKRFYHSESVMKKALEINNKLNLGLDENKIKLAGILHDSAKLVDKKELLNLLIENGETSHLEEIKQAPQILHALAGAYYIQEHYDIQDLEIINAVKYHCTGRENMTTLEELIFVSDYAEDLRVGEHFDNVRNVWMKYGLKAACCEELKQVIKYFQDEKIDAYYLTQQAWEFYKQYDYKLQNERL